MRQEHRKELTNNSEVVAATHMMYHNTLVISTQFSKVMELFETAVRLEKTVNCWLNTEKYNGSLICSDGDRNTKHVSLSVRVLTE